MLLTRLYLRNFRVFESELDLALPPGLVGIYGPNGAGKSTLLEAIVFTLWGRARTGKDDIRTAGVGGDCTTEVEFEHEGHLYRVRRRLTGIGSTPKAEATCDDLQMSEGVRDTARYLHSVLGMDDGAFRASVFAEQKQLAAFSNQTPDARRKLVLQLLGVTPLDGARDAARRDARTTRDRHDHLRSVLPDVAALRTDAADADAAAAAAEVVAAEAAGTVDVAEQRAADAAADLARLEAARHAYEALVASGKAVRAQLDQANEAARTRSTELAALDEAAEQLREAEAGAEGLDADEAVAGPLQALAVAVAAAERAVAPPRPPDPDPTARDAAAAAAAEARSTLGEVEGEHRAVAAELERARAAAARSAELSGEADCPLCGQALGSAWEQVRDHRAGDVAAAEARLAELSGARTAAAAGAKAALDQLQRSAAALEAAERAARDWQALAARADDARAAVDGARAALAATAPELAAGERSGAELAALATSVAARARSRREAAATATRLRGRLEARPAVAQALTEAQARATALEGEVQALRDQVRDLGYDPAATAAVAAAATDAATRAAAARRAAEDARVRAAGARATATAAAQRVDDALAQHATLADLAADSIHLSRLADLLSDFRNTVVASVGPRLAVQAAELFGELTDHEYDELQVDPETYGLQISDGGRVFGLERFSGSEVDLANLALRVAISEHIRFQSGGSVGLLVLDEVFGPLDSERRARMLSALERLRGRFRQVLCVTHDSDIKEQLPNAIEVVKLPGRRATARLLAG